jgi:hypothetical protein
MRSAVGAICILVRAFRPADDFFFALLDDVPDFVAAADFLV